MLSPPLVPRVKGSGDSVCKGGRGCGDTGKPHMCEHHVLLWVQAVGFAIAGLPAL